MLISQSVVNLLNGVSQQPPSVRSASQAQDQINLDSDLKDGLTSRPPTQFKASLVNSNALYTFAADSFFHVMDFGPGDRWLMGISRSDANPVKVVNIETGALASVVYRTVLGGAYGTNYNVGGGYLLPADPPGPQKPPSEVFKAVTILDSTFIVNTSRQVGGVAAGSDVITGSVQTFSDLPITGTLNAIYRITGTDASNFQAFYVRWDGARYIETRFNGSGDFFPSPYSMPHLVTKLSATMFIVEPKAYPTPLVGDVSSVPPATFFQRYIQDVTFFRNRLVFITHDSITMSRGDGDYFNFYPRTATAVRDDDPIDAFITHTNNFTLRHAIPFSGSAVLFGDTAQFLVRGGDVLSPRSVQVTPASDFSCSSKVRPLALGSRIIFPQSDGHHSRLQEYFVDADYDKMNAFDVTSHVPTLIKGNITALAGSSLFDIIVCATDDAEDGLHRLYVYRWKQNEDRERIQSSWSTYEFPSPGVQGRVLWAKFIESKLYLVLNRNMTLSVECIDYAADAPLLYSDGTLWSPCMDHQIRGNFGQTSGLNNGQYDAVNDRTQVSLSPHQHLGTAAALEGFRMVALGIAGQNVGMVSPPLLPGPNPWEVYIPGRFVPWEVGPLYMGIPFASTYEMSPLFYRNKNGGAQTAYNVALLHLNLALHRTAFLQIDCTPTKRPTTTRTFSALTGTNVVLGKITPVTEEIRVSVKGDSKTTVIALKNTSVYPVTLSSLTWTGILTSRAKVV